ncbi:MAG: hypothetical protein HN509_01750 [Halobacteriovoraceae bacterium]|nr:hypothetical protein [Halobacteriovoraceae bacterium]
MKAPNAVERRELLTRDMDNKKAGEIHCLGCSGPCCTFRSNSMQMTPLETLDLLDFLKSKKRWTEELRHQLQECVTEFRLDYDLDTGGGHNFRRTYTCPFFTPGPKGCSIEPNSKPYGCLGFNPQAKNISDGENCGADQELLLARDKRYAESEALANQALIERYALDWQKKAIPNALLALDKEV